MTKPKRKKGRPSKPNVSRTPSGQISRAIPPKDIMDVALAYREQHYGITGKLTVEQQRAASTSFGRLWLRGLISDPLWRAGERYLGIYEDFQRAVKAPVGLRKTVAAGSGGDVVTLEYIEWTVAAIGRWKALKLRGWPVLQAVVLDGQECSPTMLPELIKALTIQAPKLGITLPEEETATCIPQRGH